MTQKRANFRVSETEFDLFTELCKKNDSNASRELRLFIKDYIKRNTKLEVVYND